jgi:CHAT domain-containing protein
LDAAALQIAADIALRKRLPRVALLLLDQAVMTTSEVIWLSNGAPILLLYGQALEQLQDTASADIAYSVASDLAKRDRGSVYITAQSLRSDLAKRRGDRQGALRFAGDAFRTVLDGRSRIGRETYKLSFITTSQTAGEKYFNLQLASGAPASEVLGNIEAWRLQIFKDIYRRGQLGSNLDPGLVADRLAKVLNANEAYVAFTLSDTQSFAVVVTPEGPSIVRLSVGRAQVRRDLDQLRLWLDPRYPMALGYIRRNYVPPELKTVLRSLHDALIEPLGLPLGTAALLVSPDETLTPVPWSALLQPDDSPSDAGQPLHPLSERMTIAVVPSAQLLLGEATPTHDDASGGLGLIGAFGRVQGVRLAVFSPLIPRAENVSEDLPELQHGLEEVSAIADAMKGRPITVLVDSATLGKQQTKTLLPSPGVASRVAALALLPAASIIHIAGHAVFDTRMPMQSGFRERQRALC